MSIVTIIEAEAILDPFGGSGSERTLTMGNEVKATLGWLHDAVISEIYPQSFQDSTGDDNVDLQNRDKIGDSL